ncbi:MAG: hypothetical protein PG981_000196 [Wolbachia endosymbiont of Ctenocephalides orientis wCori]|nr:MAG: hypothetical protein PG981_000196 [Wolbachia endosymbiont of Ctenocephalides orientis wCori]
MKDSKNQKLIETFLEKLLEHASESNYMQHVLDNIKYAYNIHSTKAFFTLIERKGINAEEKDKLALEIVKHLHNNVINTKGNRKQKHRNENNLDELNKAKEVLE